MMTLDVSQALELARERWEKMFPVENEDAKLASWDPPFFLRGIGLVARLSLMDKKTYRGPNAEVVIVPLDRLSHTAEALDELTQKIQTLKKRGLASALESPIEETLGLEKVQVTKDLFVPDEVTITRRKEALELMNERFLAVAQRMHDVYGLKLPHHLAVFAAFWRSLDDLERKGMQYLGRSPGGVMIWFEDGGLSRKTRDNLDPRLECRFRCDPPEFVTFMWGDSDGLHYGLWYDDPADPPTFLVHNYARDSAETCKDEEPTPITLLRAQAKELLKESDEEPTVGLHAVLAALEWFIDADRAAQAKDPPAKRWLKATRIPTLGTFGPALPPNAGTVKVDDPQARIEAWKNQPARIRKLIDSAKRDCAAGQPAAALTFGLDLHWLDPDEYREEGFQLLLAAYEKLGRRAHAETLKVHHQHRDLPSVGVFLKADEEDERTAD